MGSNFAYQLREDRAESVSSAGHLASDDAIAAQVMRLLDRVDCRLAETDEERDAIFRLRYRAYLRSEGIAPNASEKFSDPYDDIGNVFLFGLYDGNALASSVRIHVASKDHPEFPTLDVFPDILRPRLDAGEVMIDTTRFVADAELARLNRVLPYATLRLCGLAARHFHADYLLAAVRTEHQAFYRRAFGHELVCSPRSYPMLAKPVCLMMAQVDQIYHRYQFLRSTFAERRLLFTASRAEGRNATPLAPATAAAPF
jgi:N-acyl-L-homoserine lactone synthetase